MKKFLDHFGLNYTLVNYQYAGKWTRNEPMEHFLLNMGDIPASYVSLPEGSIIFGEMYLGKVCFLGASETLKQARKTSGICHSQGERWLFVPQGTTSL